MSGFLGFVVGLFVGVAASLFAISLCAASDKREKFCDEEDVKRQRYDGNRKEQCQGIC